MHSINRQYEKVSEDNIKAAALNSFYREIPSDLDVMRELLENALDFIRNGCKIGNEKDLFELKVIFNELLLNAILHGNGEDRRKKVRLSLDFTGDRRIHITVEDEGPGYDHELVIKKNFCSMEETGRGILIVKALSERLDFSGTGNRVTAIKKV